MKSPSFGCSGTVVFAACVSCLAIGPAAAATLVVSPTGDDTDAGAEDATLRTISRAAELAMPGDTVLVREGVYRERVTPRRGGEPGKPITYRAAPGERVIVKGSEIWKPDWKPHSDGIYSAAPSEDLFDDRSDEYLDHHNPFKVHLASTPWSRNGRREHERRLAGEDRLKGGDVRIVYTCGQVFVSGQRYLEVPLQEELEPQSWFYEPTAGRIYVHFGDLDPQEHEVEITTRRRLFAPLERGLGHITVEGFVFEHCGNQYPTNFWDTDEFAQKGAVGTEAGRHWIIRRNVIRYAKTFALDVGRVDRHSKRLDSHDNLVEENYIVDNGSAGILTNGSRNLVIRNNVILRNNHLRFLGIKRWEQAGIKCHNFDHGLIEGNYIADNYDTYGVWLDNQFPDCRVTRNVIHGNGRAGIFLEMSDYDYDRLLIDNNLVFDNAENAVYIHDASGATFAHNLLAGTGESEEYGQAIFIRQVTTRTSSRHHSFYNNLLIGNGDNVEVNYPALRSGPQRFDHNIYGVAPGSREFAINSSSDKPRPWSADAFAELIVRDLNYGAPQSELAPQDGLAKLTLPEWRAFWRRHGFENDAHSQLDPAASASFDRESLMLTLKLGIDPASIGSTVRRDVDRDFLGAPMPASDHAAPGPFQELRVGENRFTVWDGLPLIADGELPSTNWNR